mmetsp:Transcript_29303/g.70288  ORF Transcript_29303/g.70288 Transcript_29303/m.70288 type:complete len:226 (-) Transcript_29303:135-812(-)
MLRSAVWKAQIVTISPTARTLQSRECTKTPASALLEPLVMKITSTMILLSPAGSATSTFGPCAMSRQPVRLASGACVVLHRKTGHVTTVVTLATKPAMGSCGMGVMTPPLSRTLALGGRSSAATMNFLSRINVVLLLMVSTRTLTPIQTNTSLATARSLWSCPPHCGPSVPKNGELAPAMDLFGTAATPLGQTRFRTAASPSPALMVILETPTLGPTRRATASKV